MDQTNSISQRKDSIGLQHTSRTTQCKQTVHTQSGSKQTQNASPTESKRVIKQIVSLDSKKLKALGIESNILSALTKFNGKGRPLAKAQPLKPSASTSTSAPTLVDRSQTESFERRTTSAGTILSVQPIVTTHDTTVACSKSPETPSTKKIHVLSNVLLNEHKLNLKDFTAIASTTTVHGANIAYVSQVPNRDGATAPIKCESIAETDNISFISNATESTGAVVDDSIVEIQVNRRIKDKKTDERRKAEGEKVKKTIHAPLHEEAAGSDTLKGFSSSDLKCSRNQIEYLQNKIKPEHYTTQPDFVYRFDHTTTEPAPSPSKHMENVHAIEPDRISAVESCGSALNTKSETISSSESSGDSESDLEELEREAQRIIENELEKSESDQSSIEQTKYVQNDSLVLPAENIDKDSFIDKFLDSTISSFHINFVAHTDDSDDSSTDSNCDDTDNILDTAENECNAFDSSESQERKFAATQIEVISYDDGECDLNQSPESPKCQTDSEIENKFSKTKRKKLNAQKSDEGDGHAMLQSQEDQAINEQIQPSLEGIYWVKIKQKYMQFYRHLIIISVYLILLQ